MGIQLAYHITHDEPFVFPTGNAIPIFHIAGPIKFDYRLANTNVAKFPTNQCNYTRLAAIAKFYLHVCKHSVTVVASIKYPRHISQVIWLFNVRNFILRSILDAISICIEHTGWVNVVQNCTKQNIGAGNKIVRNENSANEEEEAMCTSCSIIIIHQHETIWATEIFWQLFICYVLCVLAFDSWHHCWLIFFYFFFDTIDMLHSHTISHCLFMRLTSESKRQ